MKRELKEQYDFQELRAIIADLRSEEGCPWDRAQTHESIRTYMANETEEVYRAVEQGDRENLCEELGDVLYQILLHAQIAEEEGAFTMDDVITGISRKMIRRHPYIFGLRSEEEDGGKLSWQEIKQIEKDGVPDRKKPQ